MLRTKTALLTILLSFLLLLFIINSIYMGAYSFINPFLFIYYGITLLLLFSVIEKVFAVSILISIVFAAALEITREGSGKFYGYFGHAAFGGLFISVIIIQFFIFIAIPCLFAYMLSKGSALSRSIYFPVTGVFFIVFTAAGIYFYIDKIDLISSANLFSAEMTSKLAAAYDNMGMDYFTAPKMLKIFSGLLKSIFFLMPGIIIIFSWMSVWISFVALKKFSRNNGGFFKRNENLLLWKSSDYFILLLIAGIIISIFSVGIYKFIGYNIILLSASVYLVQGLTIISFFFNKLNLNIFLKIPAYGIIFLFANPLVIFVVMAGIFDMWLNFRKIGTKTKNKEGVNSI